MRKKRFSIPAICLLSVMILLPTCSKDDNTPEADPKEHAWRGYFEGTFEGTRKDDNMSVSFENERFDERTGSSLFCPTFGDWPNRYSVVIMNTGIECGEGINLGLSISGLVPGIKHITKSYRRLEQEEYNYSTVVLTRRYSPGSDPVEYVPGEDDPFELEILDVKWMSDSSFPAIEAKLRGVLHRKDNPQETITVNAVYGSR
uniref:Uncharacterized protein n=1 Tax=termite gut metagenome TaxID=433724 RepID=S0DE14_9ZZZZ